MKREVLNRLHEQGFLSLLDLHFARFMAGLSGNREKEVSLAAGLLSSHRREGHICLDLSAFDKKVLIEGDDALESVRCPELKTWRSRLLESAVVGKPGEIRPMILDDRSRLYLHRYWSYEHKLASLIKGRIEGDDPAIDRQKLKDGLKRLFGSDGKNEIDWQEVAAFTALTKGFCVISGGPGTGKTTTVVKILALLLEQSAEGKCRVALAAPTGKGAMRLQEAIRNGKKVIPCSDAVKEAVPEEAATIHRLLGSIPGSPYFRHHEGSPLPHDVIVLDEASMVDLALMSKLVQATRGSARLILLGDRDQLASVEAGAVLGDICNTGRTHDFSRPFRDRLHEVTGVEIKAHHEESGATGIRDCIVELRKSYRFKSGGGIRRLCLAVNEGRADKALEILREGHDEEIAREDLPESAKLCSALRETVLKGFREYVRADGPIERLMRFDRFRILCALREGPYGVVAVNALVEQILTEEGLLRKKGPWYAGRPVLITRNDYDTHLFNGDIGILLPDPDAGNELRAFFPGANELYRRFHPMRLPEHETVYAMTVHKSQGSEF
ncbi:MAG: exodeoxyribonuclease V subunit alpha, partial [Pseudomonadota bacterium]